jgi:23S rRNA (cytidine1920-2'-O)/16S rRNA (cytidine1409-2'-O)-methyltransferase
MPTRRRADLLLVERGLFESRAKAQDAIVAGLVTADGRPVRKPADEISPTAELQAAPAHPWVSRGGVKLAAALDHFRIDARGRICLDVGASTGGFTDCLLRAGAARVCALDVGYGQLDPRLREDPRVTVIERMNVRELDCAQLPFAPTFVVCDVSFIGLAKALPPALACAAPGWRALALVKPQFEAGRADVGKGGVVRDPVVHKRVVDEVAAQAPGWGARVEGMTDSGLPGPKGNREFFLYLRAAA